MQDTQYTTETVLISGPQEHGQLHHMSVFFASAKGLGELRIARAFAVRIQEVWMQMMAQTKI